MGRLFVSNNADNVSSDLDGRNVTFVRIDTSSLPGRFVSGLEVDPNNPNRAFISYSGFSAISAGDHVYEAVYNPSTQTATFTSREYGLGGLGDFPVNDIAYDSVTGDLYAAFDLGVLRLPSGTTEWILAGDGLPIVIVPDMELVAEKRILVIGTHGLGVWYINLP